MQTVSGERLSFGGQSGPIFLLGAFTLLLFKAAPFFWPILAIALTGYAAIRIWKKKGFYFSLSVLAAVVIFMFRSGASPFWTLGLSLSIALSWFLILLGRQEMESFMKERAETIRNLEENSQGLQRQLQNANLQNLSEVSRLKNQTVETRSALNAAEKEREKWKEKYETLFQSHEAFQHTLEDVQGQLFLLKNQQPIAPSIIPQEEDSSEEKLQMEHKYALLREQFDEKSAALDHARKELFRLENALIVLQKSQEEKSLEEDSISLAEDLKSLEEQRCDLEEQIAHLQEFISILLAPKKRTPRKSKKEDSLPLHDLASQ